MSARELFVDEVRDRLLKHIHSMVGYWGGMDKSEREKLEGLAFSILSALDGAAAGLPKFIVAPDPHSDDRAYMEQQGIDWFPENDKVDVSADVSGGLHDRFMELCAVGPSACR